MRALSRNWEQNALMTEYVHYRVRQSKCEYNVINLTSRTLG